MDFISTKIMFVFVFLIIALKQIQMDHAVNVLMAIKLINMEIA